MSIAELTDMELLQRIQQDDALAFEMLYLRLWEQLFVFAMKRLGSEEDAADVVQEVFASLWARRHSLEIRGDNFKAYLFSAVKYKVINQVAAMLQNPQKLEQVRETLLPAVNNASEVVITKELETILKQEIQSLPGKMREVYLLYIEQHRTVADIAKSLSLSEQTVRNQLGLARKRLKKSLQHAMLFCFF
ncbi:RNA polymerase sigma factor [Chitinophaga japonensis]|uniref:RNA polymerase sigma-70 factor (ECF subfamily) n=1 Tax=Chitinophaga japonensis TaxID=104662 RepID=A0A562TBN9_CHIJA|nr:sigma-70 family RNA polymerase sigma factor [Chitinophaga japonensis]TWI90949.1 RNA polymerase sigma-70 factor (ECF subfamily) [Chitinophaga japonensis]